MAYTSNTQSNNPIAREIVKIELSTVTGGATEKLTFVAASMRDPQYFEEPQTTAVADSDVGTQIGKYINLTFNVIGLGETADWTALNELRAVANVCAYVKITYRDGESETLDSGETGRAIMYFNVGQTNANDGLVEVPVVGRRSIANASKSIS